MLHTRDMQKTFTRNALNLTIVLTAAPLVIKQDGVLRNVYSYLLSDGKTFQGGTYFCGVKAKATPADVLMSLLMDATSYLNNEQRVSFLHEFGYLEDFRTLEAGEKAYYTCKATAEWLLKAGLSIEDTYAWLDELDG